MRLSTPVLFALCFIFILSACKTKTASSSSTDSTVTNSADYAITNVSLIPMTKNTIIPNQTVLIKGDKIIKIGDAKKVTPPSSAKVINGSGKYLMPGLSEMHAHIPVAQDGDETYVKETLFLYLANGITTIRGMLGNPYHLELKPKVANGTIQGPRIYTSSPSMNGNTIPNPEEARKKTTQYKKDGYDFLKVHPGIPLNAFNEMVKTANEVGIPFAGHVPLDVGIRRAISAKYETIDHVDGYIEGLVPYDANVNPNENGFFGYNFSKIVDTKMIPDLAQATKSAGIWIVPTQSLMVRVTSGKSAEAILNEPEMKYLPSKTRYQWRQQGRNWMLGNSEKGEGYAEKFIEVRNQIIKTLHDKGVGVLLGSDSPQVFNVPGFSIQHELQSLVDAGLTPYEALATGSTNVGKFYNAEGQFGTLVEGAIADMILLDDNPLTSIDNLKKKAGVFYKGNYLAKAEIEKRLAEVAERHRDE